MHNKYSNSLTGKQAICYVNGKQLNLMVVRYSF